MELATDAQKRYIKGLLNGNMKEVDRNYLENECTKKEADAWIQELNEKKAQNTTKSEVKSAQSANNLKDKEYSIAFQAFVKAACELYKGRTDKTFKDVFNEVKEVY